MTLQPIKEAAMREANAVQLRPLNEPVVVQHAAFTLSPASYDEITRVLRARDYHHVFDEKNGAIYTDHMAFVRGQTPPSADFCSAHILENNKPGADHRYLMIDAETGVPQSTTDIDKAFRFSRYDDANTFAKFLANFSAVCSPTIWAPVAHIWG